MPAEMYNDALFFKECASRSSKGTIEERRCLRASLIFSIAALESYISKVIDSYIASNPSLNVAIKDELEELNRKPFLEERIYESLRLMTGIDKPLDKGTEPWQLLRKVKDARNRLIHYRREFAEKTYGDDITLGTIEKGLVVSQIIAKEIARLMRYPEENWMTQRRFEEFDR